ncbi:MAG: hypothetical protein ACP6IS_11605 [Candidatus Asgardarchaeia archaeon]
MLVTKYFSIHMILTLNIHLPLFLEEMSTLGFSVSNVIHEFEGDHIQFIQPGNVIAFSENIRITYDPNRRVLKVAGSNPLEVVETFKRVYTVLSSMFKDIDSNVLLYEAQYKGWFIGNLKTSRKLDTKEILNFNLVEIPSRYIMENGNPNSTTWFYFDITPVWPTLSKDRTCMYELKLVYRDKIDNVISLANQFEDKIKNILDQIFPGLLHNGK